METDEAIKSEGKIFSHHIVYPKIFSSDNFVTESF